MQRSRLYDREGCDKTELMEAREAERREEERGGVKERGWGTFGEGQLKRVRRGWED